MIGPLLIISILSPVLYIGIIIPCLRVLGKQLCVVLRLIKCVICLIYQNIIPHCNLLLVHLILVYYCLCIIIRCICLYFAVRQIFSYTSKQVIHFTIVSVFEAASFFRC